MAADLHVFVDHLAGARRGERQTLRGDQRVRFGRHPDCEVSFDALRDIDASSRHAELRPTERGWMLVDLGSSNGTFVGGQRITEARVVADHAVEIEFGTGGPRVRLFVGTDASLAALPALPPPRRRSTWRWLAVAAVVVIAAAVALLTR
jgi:hypothetical protein